MRCVPRCGAERPDLGAPSNGFVEGLERRGILVVGHGDSPRHLLGRWPGRFFPPLEGIHTNPPISCIVFPTLPGSAGG